MWGSGRGCGDLEQCAEGPRNPQAVVCGTMQRLQLDGDTIMHPIKVRAYMVVTQSVQRCILCLQQKHQYVHSPGKLQASKHCSLRRSFWAFLRNEFSIAHCVDMRGHSSSTEHHDSIALALMDVWHLAACSALRCVQRLSFCGCDLAGSSLMEAVQVRAVSGNIQFIASLMQHSIQCKSQATFNSIPPFDWREKSAS
eukprot:973006-Pelagomonas_calceolata.AAC.2